MQRSFTNNNNNDNDTIERAMTDATLTASPWDNAVTFSSGFSKQAQSVSATVESQELTLNKTHFYSHTDTVNTQNAQKTQNEEIDFDFSGCALSQHSQMTRAVVACDDTQFANNSSCDSYNMSNLYNGPSVSFASGAHAHGGFGGSFEMYSKSEQSQFDTKKDIQLQTQTQTQSMMKSLNSSNSNSNDFNQIGRDFNKLDVGFDFDFGFDSNLSNCSNTLGSMSHALDTVSSMNPNANELSLRNFNFKMNEINEINEIECKPLKMTETMGATVNTVNTINTLNTNFGIEDDVIDIDIDMESLFVPSKLTTIKQAKQDTGSGFDNDLVFEELVRGNDGCCIKPRFYNEFTTCLTQDSPQTVLLKLENILTHEYPKYSQLMGVKEKQIDSKQDTHREVNVTRINKDDFTIEGNAFIRHRPIKFLISIWHETAQSANTNIGTNTNINNNFLTRIEFLKHRGDGIVFSQFWYEMLELMFHSLKNVSGVDRCENFDSFSMPSFSLPSISSSVQMDVCSNSSYTTSSSNSNSCNNNNNAYEEEQGQGSFNYKNKDLDEMALDLRRDYRNEAIDIIGVICEELETSEMFAKMVYENESLLKAIIAMLGHFDVCHVRGALCALNIVFDARINDFGLKLELELKMDDMKFKGKTNFLMFWQLLGQLVNLWNHGNEMIRMRTKEVMQKLADLANLKYSEWDLKKMGEKEKEQMITWFEQFSHDAELLPLLRNIECGVGSV